MSTTTTERVCAQTEPGDVMTRCACGLMRPAHRPHGWVRPVRVRNGVAIVEGPDDDDPVFLAEDRRR